MRLPHHPLPESLDAALRSPRRRFLGQTLAGAGLAAGGRLALPLQTAFASQDVPDWDVPGGHFYTQAVTEPAGSDLGYVVSNADGIQFWRDYSQLGGPAQLGYPISDRFQVDGVVYQAMQAALLRWDPAAQRTHLEPVLASLGDMGLDGWLYDLGIPRPAVALIEDPALPTDVRLGWLTHPALRGTYMGRGQAAAMERFGLPMGEPERFGAFIAQRFEKGALQLWLDAVPGQPVPGTVSLVHVGDLLKQAALIPEDALEPQAAPAPRPVAPPPAPEPRPAPATPQAPPAPGAPGGGRQVVVSLGKQWWYAYQNGELVFNGPVTTGQPELATPAGSFTILSRHSPYTMISPWPRGHRFYYPPAHMTYALRITGNGVFLHDAPWRPYYGPGTNVPHRDPDGVWRTGSHGCINLPFGAAAWLWNFAPLGTPVRVVF